MPCHGHPWMRDSVDTRKYQRHVGTGKEIGRAKPPPPSSIERCLDAEVSSSLTLQPQDKSSTFFISAERTSKFNPHGLSVVQIYHGFSENCFLGAVLFFSLFWFHPFPSRPLSLAKLFDICLCFWDIFPLWAWRYKFVVGDLLENLGDETVFKFTLVFWCSSLM